MWVIVVCAGWFWCGGESKSQVCIFEAACLEQLDDWAEGRERKRVWVRLEDARLQCKHKYMEQVLDSFLKGVYS